MSYFTTRAFAIRSVQEIYGLRRLFFLAMNEGFESVAVDSRTVLISQNPRSGSSNRAVLIEELANELQRRGFEVETIQDIDRLCGLAKELLDNDKLRTVVSAGGDGTVSLLVNRLPPKVPFTIFPLGTANLLAKHLRASLDVNKVADTIESGYTVRLDVGKANEKLFIVVASCGFDADVVHKIHDSRKGHISYWSYGWPVMQSIFGYSFPQMKFTCDGDEGVVAPARWAFVLNVPEYAMNLKFADAAIGNDGKLDICSFRRGGFFAGIFYFFAVLFRQHSRLGSTQFAQFKSMTIEAKNSDLRIPVELDGDPAGFLPVEIGVEPNRLRVVVSENWNANRS